MGLNQEALVDFFVHHAKLGLNDGKSFGKTGEGYMRLNVGTSRVVLEEAMQRSIEEIDKHTSVKIQCRFM